MKYIKYLKYLPLLITLLKQLYKATDDGVITGQELWDIVSTALDGAGINIAARELIRF